MASVILGALSLFCSCFTALPGVICGIVALANIGKSNGQLKGRGLAILGIILALLLTVVGAVGFMVSGGRKLAEMPEMKEIFGAIPTMTQASTRAIDIAAALKAHADANQGRLPASLDELAAAGRLDAASLLHPVDKTPGFWKLEPPPGTLLASLPPQSVVVRSIPIKVVDESLEIVIFANGEVKPQEVAAPPAVTPADAEATDADSGSPDAPDAPEAGAPETAPPFPGAPEPPNPPER